MASCVKVDRAAPMGSLMPLGAVYLTEWKPSHLACTTRGPETPAVVQAAFILIKNSVQGTSPTASRAEPNKRTADR